MAGEVIEERIGIASEQEAQDLAAVLQLNGWATEVEQGDIGTWLVRAYPPGFGSTAPAENEKVSETPPQDDPPNFNPGNAQGLLDFIARFESGGNYNAYYAHGNNNNDPRLTSMLIGNVIDWQRTYVRGGSPSSAAGKYQIIRKTLQSLVRDLNLDATTVRFNASVQDSLAMQLLKGRGLKKYQDGNVSTEAFAKNVAMEWASMPVIASTTGNNGQLLVAGQSYYANDGLNKSLVGVASYRQAIKSVKA
jgi:hypothetical protein